LSDSAHNTSWKNVRFAAVQHGPQYEWSLRNDPVQAGSNYGPPV
jgi:hypothetical protein